MGTNFELNMNDFLPLRDVVFNTLRQAILRGELQPGERLLEIHLADKTTLTALLMDFKKKEKERIVALADGNRIELDPEDYEIMDFYI